MSSSPLFSKRHYEWLARWAGRYATRTQCYELARELQEQDLTGRFDPQRFLTACDILEKV